MSNPGKRKYKKAKVQNYKARELWERSPSPAEDWGSDAERDFDLEVVGEEVGYGEIKYEVAWKDWQRADGSSTTWEGSDSTSVHLPTSAWEAKRIAALPNTPDIQLWGTTDIANTATRERKQGYKEATEQERAKFTKNLDAMKHRMDVLLADKMKTHPELFGAATCRGATRPTASVTKHPGKAQTRPRPTPVIPPRQRSQVNAEAGPSRIRANAEAALSRPQNSAEAGPSRRRPSAAASSCAPLTPSSSRPAIPSMPIHQRAPSLRPPAGSKTPSSRPPERTTSSVPPQRAHPLHGASPATSKASSSRPTNKTFPCPQSAPSPRAASTAGLIASSSNRATPSMSPQRAPPPRPVSPAISISSTESIEITDYKPALSVAKQTPAPRGLKRKASSPIAAPPPLMKRRLPGLREPPSAGGSSSISNIPVARATPVASSPISTASTSTSGTSSKPRQHSHTSVPRPSPFTTPSLSIESPHKPASTSSASCSRGPPTASTSRLTPPTHSSGPPLRLQKRKADDGVLSCPCGNVYRNVMCDTCHSSKKQWLAPGSIGDARTDVIRHSSVSGRTRRSLEKSTSENRSLVQHLSGSIRKGKGRETAKSLRLKIETAWSLVYAPSSMPEEDRAAEIAFVNDVDDEPVPSSVLGEFEYLEDAYKLSDTLGVAVDPAAATPLLPSSFFAFCDKDCIPDCTKVELCGCQDKTTVSAYAYTDGLFNFTYGLHQVVVECNPYCVCSMDCPNRVTQRPRKIPIEVFKTPRCGWGARASVDVEKGRVLGVYTGKLIPRMEAKELEGLANEYCFDLDYNEEDTDELYSVDSQKCGNWTRFINHSCAPNVRVQPVVYDTLPFQHMAFLAFITTEFIPARKEFTFDYDPEAQREFDLAAAEGGKSWKPDNATECVCGASSCRGWVRT